MRHEDVLAVLTGPVAQEILHPATTARIAYNGLDGFPRAIPIGVHFNGQKLIMCTTPKAEKVAALRKNPHVALTIDTAQPVRSLLIRGTTSIEIVDGVPDEFLISATPEFEATVRDLYDQMARISIEVTWAKTIDFETNLPSAVEEIVRRKRPEMLSGD